MHNRNRGFTLIELLVVIAIIAILAAILFPVFAQAKMAAKGAASVSNCKQISTAIFCYMADFDDHSVLLANDDANAPFLLLGRPYKPWAYLCLPYTKNGGIFQDPLTVPEPVPAGWDTQTLYTYRTQIGYAFTALSPVGVGEPSPPYWTQNTLSNTQVAKPADTVMLTIKKTRYGNGDWLWLYGGIPGPIWGSNIVRPPYCPTFQTPAIIFPQSVCPPSSVGACGWGMNCDVYPGQTFEEGAVTGGVAMRKATNSIVGWADGHVSVKSAGALAVGTNWTRTLPYTAMAITDINKYLWDGS